MEPSSKFANRYLVMCQRGPWNEGNMKRLEQIHPMSNIKGLYSLQSLQGLRQEQNEDSQESNIPHENASCL